MDTASPFTTPIKKSHTRHPQNLLKYTSPPSAGKETLSDRFIPVRAQAERFLEDDVEFITESPDGAGKQSFTEPPAISPYEKTYNALLKGTLEASAAHSVRKKLCFDDQPPAKILSFRAEPDPVGNIFEAGIFGCRDAVKPVAERKIPQAPALVLDSPGLKDDPLRNILDWSATDLICVGIDSSVYYLHNSGATSGTLLEFPYPDPISSVSFNPSGTTLAVGADSGTVRITDPATRKIVRQAKTHTKSVTATCWGNEAVFVTGSLDGRVILHDIRAKVPAESRETKAPVVTLKTTPDTPMVAGGMACENTVQVWDLRKSAAAMRIHTSGPVRAIGWLGGRFLGMGTIVGRVKVWNVTGGSCGKEIETGGPIWSLLGSRNTKEMVTGHSGGMGSNPVMVWKWPEGTRVGVLSGHTARVMHMALSPDGKMVVTAAGDETLRFWDLFPSDGKCFGPSKSLVMPSCMDLR